MLQIHLACDTNAGGRPYNEDRVEVTRLTTPGGLALDLAVLCDGVGGEERGERAAQLGIDTVLAYLRQAEEPEVPLLLVNAIKAANAAVFAEAQRMGQSGRMAATIVVAAALRGETLFIANAGDARIYLIRDGKLTQITRDHNFANVMVWMEKLTPEAAAASPEANKVMRALGIRETLQVDLGLYESTTDYGQANRLGRAGLALKEGDAVLLCSDGLVKKTPATGQTLISETEILRVVRAEVGDRAARALMGIALGRIPVGEKVDNISVAVMQTEDPQRAAYLADLQRQKALAAQRSVRRRVLAVAAMVAIPLVVLVFGVLALAGALWWWGQQQQTSSAAANTQLAAAATYAAGETATVGSYTATPPPTATPTPTPTPVPSAVPTAAAGEVAKVFVDGQPAEVITDDGRMLVSVPADETRYLAITYLRYNANSPVNEDGNVHLLPNAQLELDVVTVKLFQMILLPGSDVLVQTGPYPEGAEVQLANTNMVFEARGCLALRYTNPAEVLATCYAGECGYSRYGAGEVATLPPGREALLALDSDTPAEPKPIAEAEHLRYWGLLAQTGVGASHQQLCQIPNLQATREAAATARARRTAQAAATASAAAPEATPTPRAPATEAPGSGGGGGEPAPTSQPEPPASAPPPSEPTAGPPPGEPTLAPP